MAVRVRPRQTDWTAGELSPSLEGRVDLDKYLRSAKRLENFLLLTGGGFTRRPGTRFIATAAGQARLVPFLVSTDAAYILEFTNNLIRFYTQTGRLESGGVPVQVTTTYITDELAALHFAQSNDVLYIAHQSHPPARLERITTTSFRLRDVDFSTPTEPGVPTALIPTFEFGTRCAGGLGGTLTPGATSGSGISMTASSAVFLAGHVGRRIRVVAGTSIGAVARITGFTSTTVVTATIEEVFANTSAVPNGSWIIDTSPRTTCTPSATGPVGASITLTLAADGFQTVADVGKTVRINGGLVHLVSFASPLLATGFVVSELTGVTAAPSGAWSIEDQAWGNFNGQPAEVQFLAEDRLGFYNVGTGTPGLSRAFPHTGWLSRTGDYHNFTTGIEDDAAITFTLNTDQLNAIRWARSLSALVIGTSGEEFVIDPGPGGALLASALPPARAVTGYGSSPTVAPVKAGNVLLHASRANRQLWEFVFSQDTQNYVANDMLLLADHLTRPITISFVRATRRLMGLAFQRQPDSIVWAPREDGVLLSMTYRRDQGVVAWARHFTGPTTLDPEGYPIPTRDFVESVATIPHPDGDRDQVWLSVQRTINGAVVRLIEVFDDAGLFYDTLLTDATLTYNGIVTDAAVTPGAGATVKGTTGVTFTASAPKFTAADVGKEIRNLFGTGRATITGFSSTTVVTATINTAFPSLALIPGFQWGLAAFTFAGLTHLIGETVDVLGDGMVYPQQVVSAGGSITVTPAALMMEVGLPYVSSMLTLRPNFETQLGSTQGQRIRPVVATVRVLRSVGGKVNGEFFSYREAKNPMDLAVPDRSGDTFVPVSQGWDREGRVLVTQDQPLPLTVLLLTGTWNVGVDAP